MDLITCPHCLVSCRPPAGERPPPWCRQCGGDLRARPVEAAEAEEELVPLTAAEPVARPSGGRWANQRPSGRRPAAATTRPSAGVGVADRPASATDTPPPAGRWTDSDDRRTEERLAREVGLKPPAWWGYLFAGACAVIPVVSLGGAVPCALGFGGASACVKIAHSHTMSTPAKLLACLAVTGLVWGLFVVLLVVAFKVAAGVALRGR